MYWLVYIFLFLSYKSIKQKKTAREPPRAVLKTFKFLNFTNYLTSFYTVCEYKLF